MKKMISIVAIAGLILALAPSAYAAAFEIDHLPNFLGTEPQDSSSVSDTGILPIDAVAAGYTLTITATAKYGGGPSEVGQTNGGLVANNPGNRNRFRDDATIIFNMVIKDAGSVDVTSDYSIKITDLYAFVDAGQDVLKIDVDSGAAIYSFPKTAGTGNAAIWAQGTVPQYTIPDPSAVSFLSVGNNGGGLRFNFNGIKMDIALAGTATPGTVFIIQ